MNGILERWNHLPTSEAADEILPCCGSRTWANNLTAHRPFEDVATLLATSDRIWQGLTAADWLEAFGSDPRIGETRKPVGASARSQQWSSQEQSRAADSPEAVKQALAEGNRLYERKFQRIFIICATGKSAPEILEALQHRLNNDESAELLEAAEQQRQIIHIRIHKWLTE